MGVLVAAVLVVLAVAVPAAHADLAGGGQPVQQGPSGLPPGCSALGAQPTELELEPAVAADPRDPAQVVAAWVQGPHLALATARSSDGGRTWSAGRLDGITACDGRGQDQLVYNPSLDIGPDGTAYLAATATNDVFPNPGSAISTIVVARSSDGGAAWQVSRVPSSEGANDYPHVAALPGRPGAAVVVWKKSAGLAEMTFISRTQDGGATWSAPVAVRRTGTDRLAGNRVHALKDGSLLLVSSERSLSGLLGGERLYRAPVEVVVSRLAPAAVGWEETARFALGDAWTHLSGFVGLASTTDVEGRLHLALPVGTTDGSRLERRVSADGGRSFTGPEPIDLLPPSATPQEIVVDDDGCTAVVTGDEDPSRPAVRLLRRCRSTRWRSTTLSDAGYPTERYPPAQRWPFYWAPDATALPSGFLVVGAPAAGDDTAVTAWRAAAAG